MPILLDTAWEAPVLPGVTHPRALLTQLYILPDQSLIQLKVEYGDVVEGVWVPNSTPHHLSHEISGTDYDNIVDGLTLDGETIYDALKRLVYAHLQSEYPHLAGTIE